MVVGEFIQETDLVIIGGGPAGYSAAFRAAELGVQAIIVDSRPDGALGGVCLHEGCIPSKTLLHVAETIQLAEHAAKLGVNFGEPKIDPVAVYAWRDRTISKLAGGLDGIARKLSIERINGAAHFEASRTLAITGGANTRIRFKRALIATGSVHRHHPRIPAEGTDGCVLTPSQAIVMQSVPKTMLIVGHDYMAIELAGIFAALGTDVTLVNEADSFLPDVDADLVRPLLKALERRLHALHSNLPVKLVERTRHGTKVTFDLSPKESTSPKPFEHVIVSAGQNGHVRTLHLEKTQVKVTADSFIEVDEQMRTSDPRVFAAGDVTGTPLLANKAHHQGRIVAEVVAGKKVAFDARAIPCAIFTDPPIAWCGLTERNAKSLNMPHAVTKIPRGASGRAVGMGRSDGLTKIVYQPDSLAVLGVGMVGPQACEMISEAALAIEMGATLTDLALTMHPHPTISELISDAARGAQT